MAQDGDDQVQHGGPNQPPSQDGAGSKRAGVRRGWRWYLQIGITAFALAIVALYLVLSLPEAGLLDLTQFSAAAGALGDVSELVQAIIEGAGVLLALYIPTWTKQVIHNNYPPPVTIVPPAPPPPELSLPFAEPWVLERSRVERVEQLLRMKLLGDIDTVTAERDRALLALAAAEAQIGQLSAEVAYQRGLAEKRKGALLSIKAVMDRYPTLAPELAALAQQIDQERQEMNTTIDDALKD